MLGYLYWKSFGSKIAWASWRRLFSSQTFSRINTPTFSNLVILHTYPPMKMEQSVPKRRHIKFRLRGIIQKEAYNVVKGSKSQSIGPLNQQHRQESGKKWDLVSNCSGNYVVLYSGVSSFAPRPKHNLSSSFSWFPSVPPGKYRKHTSINSRSIRSKTLTAYRRLKPM